MNAAFGARVKAARQNSGLTLEQLATKLGSSKAYVWQIENKTAASPSADLLMKLCTALSQPPSYFISSGDDFDDFAERDILYRKFSTLSERDRESVKRIIDALEKND